MSYTQITVPFHGSSLSIIEHNGEPYAPMKPIVEGMGLDWSYQSRKLSTNKDRWTIAVIATVAQDDKNREAICIPLRKLFGWLQTLQPNRVRRDIRPKVIQFQNECDDVLWQHWTDQLDQHPPAKALRVEDVIQGIPMDTRYLLIGEGSGTSRMTPIDISEYSLVHVSTVRHLQRDIIDTMNYIDDEIASLQTTRRRLQEMKSRMMAFTGDFRLKDFEKRIL